MDFPKPFKTYHEQIDKLKLEYGLIVEDDNFAIHALSTISYYDLINGYKKIFMKNEKFIDGITLELLYSFYLFDANFQSIIFKQSMLIENMFKTRLAYVLSENIPEDINYFLSEEHYHKSAQKKIKGHKYPAKPYFKDVKSNILKSYDGDFISNPTKFYKEKHSQVPAWIIFKNISFGDAINVYILLKRKIRENVSNHFLNTSNIDYGNKYDFIKNSLNIIRDFRNKISHNLNFSTHKSYNRLNKETIRAILPDFMLTDEDIKFNRGTNDIYSFILSTIIILDNDFLVFEFLNEIYSYISPRDTKNMNQFEKRNEESRLILIKYYMKITNLPQDLSNRIEQYLEFVSPK